MEIDNHKEGNVAILGWLFLLLVDFQYQIVINWMVAKIKLTLFMTETDYMIQSNDNANEINLAKKFFTYCY